MAKTNFEKRCEDCANMKMVKGCMICEECFGQKCSEIDDCPEGATVELIDELEKFAKENKFKNINSADKPKTERKPRERKVDITKVEFIKKILELAETFGENATIVKAEREVTFDFAGENYSIQLVKHRKPKQK